VSTPAHIGRLEYVELREVWAHEALAFTPWLLQNADVLEDVLGIELQLDEPEHAVGSFSLDLLGKDLTHDAVLIVENQIEATDHGHLGQLVTYAAGTEAGTIVWVAKEFREEHRQALDWLNRQTLDDIRFFGIAIRAVRIGDSPAAPFLEVVAKPNDWQKQVRAAASRQSGERAEAFRAFWTQTAEELRARAPHTIRADQRIGESNYLSLPSPIKGTIIYAVFGSGHLRVELYISAGSAELNREILGFFEPHRARFQAGFTEPVEFEDSPGKQVCKICFHRPGEPGVIDRPEEHDDARLWFIDHVIGLRAALDDIGDPTTAA
jgi:hypothetical protein